MEFKRDNPNNRYHYKYQRAINRSFFVFLILFSIITSVFVYGIAETAKAIALIFVISAALFVVLYIFFFIVFEVFGDVFEWMLGE